jgi:lipoprotein signal peptidase
VADSGISVGAVMLIIDGFINSDREKNSKSTSNKKS